MALYQMGLGLMVMMVVSALGCFLWQGNDRTHVDN